MEVHSKSVDCSAAGFQYPPPPSSYQSLAPPPAYQTQSASYGFEAAAATSTQYGVASHLGYAHSEILPQPPLQNNQGLQMNVIGLGAPQPVVARSVIVVQHKVITPPSFLCWSVFSFFCFLPLGLAAVICSVKVTSTQSPADARRYSMTARNLNIAALVICPLVLAAALGSLAGTAKVSAANGIYNPFVRYYNDLQSYSYISTYSYESYSTYRSINGIMYTSRTIYGSRYVTEYAYARGFSYIG